MSVMAAGLGTPQAVVVSRKHFEAIRPRGQPGVIRRPTRADVVPLLIESVEPVFEAHLGRRQQTERGVGQLDRRRSCRHFDRSVLAQRRRTISQRCALDQHAGRDRVGRKRRRIDYRDAVDGRDPDPSVAIAQPGRIQPAAGPFRVQEPIGAVEDDRFERRRAPLRHRFDPGALQPRDAPRRTHPEVGVPIFNDDGHQAIAEALSHAERFVASMAPAEEAVGGAADPEVAAAVDEQARDVARGRALGWRQHAEPPALKHRKTVGVGTNPHAPVAILREAGDLSGRHAVGPAKPA